MTTPGTRRREHTRALLLSAAAQLFAEVGLDGASIEAICERAGFTRGAFYSNFETKEELFLELTAELAASRLDAVRARVGELLESGALAECVDLVPLVQDVMQLAEEDRPSVLMMSEIRLRALRDPSLAAAYLAEEQAMVAGVEAIVAGIVDSGAFELRVDVTTAARMLMIVWEGGMVHAALEGRDDAQLTRAGSAALTALVGLLVTRS